MKKYAIALLCCAFVGISTGAPAKEKISWGKDLKNAPALAKKQKKNTIMLFFTAPGWCGPCRRLEGEAMISKGFRELAKNAVLVKMDFSERSKVTPEMNAAAQKFQIRGFPTLVILDGSGKKKGEIVGYRAEKRYLAEVKKLISKK